MTLIKEIIQVFDATKMPSEIFEDMCLKFGVAGDSYKRWYPRKAMFFHSKFDHESINEWLINNGMIIDELDEYFYILIHLDW